MQVCHAYAELLCTPLFNRLYCNVHFYFFFFMCACINTENIPVSQSQAKNFLSNIQLMKVTIAVLQCISEKHG